jgi:hypothetical protein
MRYVLLAILGWLLTAPVILFWFAIVRFYSKNRKQRCGHLHEAHVLTIYPGGERYAYRKASQTWHGKGD